MSWTGRVRRGIGRGRHLHATEKATEVDPGDASEKVPEALVAQAKALFSRRTDGGLAVLVLDSLIDENAPGKRPPTPFRASPSSASTYTYLPRQPDPTWPGGSSPRVRLPTRLELETGDLVASQATEEGAFAFPHVSHGLVRLHVTGLEGTGPVHTDWFRV